MDNAFICLIVFIRKQNRPIRGKGGRINSKTMVLGGNETTLTLVMYTGLIVTAVTIPGSIQLNYQLFQVKILLHSGFKSMD